MRQLLSQSGQLRALSGRLIDAQASACCCGPVAQEKAYLYVECCDGDPQAWVAESAFSGAAPCDIIRLGRDESGQPVCFRRDGAEDLVAAIESQGQPVTRRFPAGDGCAAGDPHTCGGAQAAGVCRTCPDQCCIKGYPPVCRPDTDPQPCCVLGSAARVLWTYSRRVREWGCFQAFGVENQYGRFTIGQRVDPILDERTYQETRGIIVRPSLPGRSCSTQRRSCRTLYRRRSSQWVQDGYTLTDLDDMGQATLNTQIEPVNGRYVEEDTGDLINTSCTISSPYPEVLAPYFKDPNTGLVYRDSCKGTSSATWCIAGEPCPSSGNPWYRSTSYSVAGQFDCLQGSQRHVRSEIVKSSPSDYPAGWTNPHSSGENERYRREEVTITYRIDIIDRTGCEVFDCEDIQLTGRGPGQPPEGCTGCRQGMGL